MEPPPSWRSRGRSTSSLDGSGPTCLLYEQGVAGGGLSPPELVEMGLFDGWLPGAASGLMEGREEGGGLQCQRLGSMVLHGGLPGRLPGGVVLASVAPLRLGDGGPP